MDQSTYRKMKFFFEPVDSIERFDEWCQYFLGIEFPWDTVDPESTSSPLKALWAIYQFMLTGKGPSTHIIAAARGTMKCLAEDTLVATPGGPIEIQNLLPGDVVYDEFGKEIKVTAVHNQGIQECVDVISYNKVLATCTPNHVWLAAEIRKPTEWHERRVDSLGRGWKIKKVELKQPLGKKNEPLAYALGALIGDGCSTEPGIRISSIDSGIPSKVASILGGDLVKLKGGTNGNYSYIIKNSNLKSGKRWHFSDFYEKNIRGKHSYTKTSDLNEIKTWDRESLVAFVAGLLDTDGSVIIKSKENNVLKLSFACQSKTAVESFAWAFNTLWQHNGIVSRRSQELKNGNAYEFQVANNYVVKKALKELTPHLQSNWKKYKPEYDSLPERNITSDRIGVKIVSRGPTQCWDITVDSPTSLYCLQNGMVTHNTLCSSGIHAFSMFQFRRDDSHTAATLNQSSAATGYLSNIITKISERMDINPYIHTSNFRTLKLVNLPITDFATRQTAKTKVITASLKGANSDRSSCFPGKTEILLWPSDEEWASQKGKYHPSKGRLKKCTMDGLWQKMQSGGEYYTLAVNPATTVIERKKIQAIRRKIDLDRLIITTESGKMVECTRNHPFATSWTGADLVYTNAENLLVGDNVILKRASICGKENPHNAKSQSIEVPDTTFLSDGFTFDDILQGTLLGDGFQKHQSNIKLEKIASITTKTAGEHKRERWVYDIQIEDHHNFFANAFLVHNCLLYDETDLVPQSILDESSLVFEPSMPNHSGIQYPPVYVYLSSRKTNTGPVQKLIDRSSKHPEDDRLHKWSASDFMKKCPPEVHQPDKDRVMAYLNTTSLQTIWRQEEFEKYVKGSDKGEWKKINAFEGCRTCPAWIPCLSNSAHQKGDAPALRTKEVMYTALRNVSDPRYLVAQVLNFRPESKGLVYQDFARHKHVKDPLSFYEWAVGQAYVPVGLIPEEYNELVENAQNAYVLQSLMPSKSVVYDAMIKAGWEFNIGVDWGSSDPAAAHVVGFHHKTRRACTLHYEQTPMANHLWAEYVEQNIASIFSPVLMCPDMADASSASYFKKHTSYTSKFHIEPGVSFIRGLLWNPIKASVDFCIYDDSLLNGELNNMIVVDSMERWSHRRLPTGDVDNSRFNDDDYCHSQDSLRYALAPYIESYKGIFSASQPTTSFPRPGTNQSQTELQAHKDAEANKNVIHDHIQKTLGLNIDVDKPVATKAKPKGSLKFTF